MFIKQLAAAAIKGRSFTHELTQQVLITGPNFSGKSAILEAVRIALTGRTPSLGKTGQAIFDLASGPEMRARVTFDNGDHIEHRFWREGKTIKSEGDTSLDEETAEKMATPLMDAGEYFSLSPAERTRYIFARGLAGKAGDPAEIIAEVERLSYEDTTDEIVAARAEAAQLLREAFEEQEFAEALNLLAAPAAKKGLLALQVGYYKKRAADMVGTVRTLAELKLRSEECSADTIYTLTAELETVRLQTADATKRLGAITQQTMAANANATKRAALEQRIANLDKEMERPATDTAPLTEALVKLREELAALPEYPNASELFTGLENASAATARLAMKKEQKTVRLAQISAERENAMHAEKCSLCGAKPTADRTKEIIANLSIEERDIESLMLTIEEESTRLNSDHERAKAAVDKMRADITTRQRLTSEIAAKVREIQTIETVERERRVSLENAKRERENFPTAESPAEGASDEIAAEVQQIHAKHAELTNRMRAATELQQAIRSAAEAEHEHSQAKAAQLVFSDALKIVETAQELAITELFKTLLEDTNFFTRDILPSPIVFENGEIGRREGLQFISYKTFSGTEEAIVYVAVAAALSRRQSFRLAAIDEMGRLDEKTKSKLVNRLSDAITDGLLDQVILIDPSPQIAEGREDWTHIAL